ncbi:MAG: YdbL family protein [Pseudobdellovibrionaceae bacterium]
MILFLRFFVLLLCTLTLFSGAVLAGSLDLMSAKRSGLIGEKADGFVAATLPNPSGDVVDLVNSTNRARLEVYKETAGKQGIALSDVERIAAEKIYSLAGSGEFIQVNGRWVQK